MSPQDIAATVAAIRDQVRERHQKTVPEITDFELPALDPLGRARDAAEGKAAAIGRVNPRPGGAVNHAIQTVKKVIARSLNWLLRDQIDYNRAVVAYMDRVIETLIEHNYNLLRLARAQADAGRQLAGVRDQQTKLGERHAELDELQRDLLKHWHNWRPAWEEKATQAEVNFLHAVREIEAGVRGREADLKSDAEAMYRDYLRVLSDSTEELQQRFWADMERHRGDQEKLIHTELRLIRRRAAGGTHAPGDAAQAASEPAPTNGSAGRFDYARFEERFRGSEDYVAENQRRYLEDFRGLSPVVDLGCGRGELLALLQAAGVKCLGVDADADSVAACLEKGLNVNRGDLFGFLADQESESLGAIVCCHVIEHLPALRLPELVELAAAKLKPGGKLAFETPNPGCLAIFAGDFYLDPTHNRPVPSKQTAFYMEEAGLGGIEIRELNPAYESIAELRALNQNDSLKPFVNRFFGGLDYAILGTKL